MSKSYRDRVRYKDPKEYKKIKKENERKKRTRIITEKTIVVLTNFGQIEIPTGYYSNGYSLVPDFSEDEMELAAIVHDYIYESGLFSRYICDNILYDLMIQGADKLLLDGKIDAIKYEWYRQVAAIYYYGVRIFGFIFYKHPKVSRLVKEFVG